MPSTEETPGKRTSPHEGGEPDSDIQWGEFYKIAVGHLGIQPSEFWAMTPQEFYLLYETRVPKDPRRTLSDEEYAELEALLD